MEEDSGEGEYLLGQISNFFGDKGDVEASSEFLDCRDMLKVATTNSNHLSSPMTPAKIVVIRCFWKDKRYEQYEEECRRLSRAIVSRFDHRGHSLCLK